jgi:hypothetical protein
VDLHADQFPQELELADVLDAVKHISCKRFRERGNELCVVSGVVGIEVLKVAIDVSQQDIHTRTELRHALEFGLVVILLLPGHLDCAHERSVIKVELAQLILKRIDNELVKTLQDNSVKRLLEEVDEPETKQLLALISIPCRLAVQVETFVQASCDLAEQSAHEGRIVLINRLKVRHVISAIV